MTREHNHFGWIQNFYSHCFRTWRPATPAALWALGLIISIAVAVPARAASGGMQAWGDNWSGELGDGTTVDRNVPVNVQNLNGVVAMAANYVHSVALTSDGTVWGWGDNAAGATGDGTTAQHHIPTPATGLTGVIAIAAGGQFTVALKSDGTVWAWGFNCYGQLGDGTLANRYLPHQVEGISGVKSIASGFGHVLALKHDGTVWGWGWNGASQLGDGTDIDRLRPVQTQGINGVTAITCGAYYSLVLKSDGTAWTWGSNYQGELGIGSDEDRLYSYPVQIPNFSGVASVSAGVLHAMALKTDGTVWTWGENTLGQLGIGTTDYYKNSPVQVQGLTDVKSVAGGGLHSLALTRDGTVWSWGYNSAGQLGDGSTNDRHSPVQVNNITHATAICGGDYHSLAIIGASGSGTCSGSPPANDNFSQSEIIAGAAGTLSAANNCATTEDGEPHAGGHSVWYSWTVPQNGRITFDTNGSDYDTTLAAYAGSSLGALTTLAYNDDSGGSFNSEIAFDVAAGSTYSIQVDGYNGSSGAFTLHWSLTPHYRILGRIATASGTAVPNVLVSRNSGGPTALTNSSGYYTLTGVPAGTHTVTPQLQGYVFNPVSRSVTLTSADVAGQNFSATAVFTISGKVSTSNGTGVPGVAILRSGNNTPATTDNNGNYSFPNVPHGSYAVAPGLNGATFTPNSAAVSPSSPTANFIATFSIGGHIALSNGTPLANVGVALSPTPAGVATPVMTNDNGNYLFSNVPSGGYTVTPALATYVFTPASLGVTVGTSPVTGRNFTAARTYTVSGRIANSAGTGIANVSVSRGGGAAPVLTNSSGYYTLPNVLPGNYTITPTLAGYKFAPASLSVTVGSTNLSNQNFVATAIFTISGTVTNNSGTAIPNAIVTLSPAPAGFTNTATTNSAGFYSFTDIPTGSYTVTPTRPGCSFNPVSRTLSPSSAVADFIVLFNISGHITKGGNGLANVSVALTTGDGSPLPAGVASPTLTNSNGDFLFSNVPSGLYYVTPRLPGHIFNPTTQGFSLSTAPRAANFVATAVYSLSGKITTGDGAAIPNVSLALTNGSSNLPPTLTNANGVYAFGNLPAGTYTVTPSLAGTAFLPVSRTVAISSASVGGLNFVGGAPFTVSGKVTNSSGTGVPTVTVLCSGGANSAVTDASGNFTFANLPAGTYTVTPSQPSSSFVPASRSVNPGSPTANFTAFFAVSGHITAVSSTGTPIANVSVTLKTSTGGAVAGATSPAFTNANGDYRFSNVPSGLYYVTPTLSGYTFSPATQGLSVATTSRAANFIGAPVFRVSGRITSSSGVALAAVTVTMSGRGSVTTNSAGYFTFANVPNGSYTVTPSQSGRTFSPASRSVTVIGSDVSGVSFIGG